LIKLKIKSKSRPNRMIDLKKYFKQGFLHNLLLLILTAHFIFSSTVPAHAQEIDEYLLKSAFIVRISVFIDWPENSSYINKNGDIIVAIIGDDPFNGKLQTIYNSRKIKNRNITVKTISKITEIDGSDILFVSNSEKYNLPKIIQYINKKPILTVSDTKAFADKGVMINMYIESGSLAFDVNLKQTNESKIYISSKLLVNANKVIK